MNNWKISWLRGALDDLDNLDAGIRKRILKAVARLEVDPLGYGEDLGRRAGLNLTGLRKLKPAPGYRVVYQVLDREVLVLIVAVGKREDLSAYREAARRIQEYRRLVGEEMEQLLKMLTKQKPGG